MSKFTEHVQGSSLGSEITLVTVDLTAYGQGVLRWIAGQENSTPTSILFDGEEYTSFPFQISELERTTIGPFARPSLVVGDPRGVITTLVNANKNFRGGIVRRIITYEKFLDDGDDPDPTATKPIEEYIINRKTEHRPGVQIRWELRASADVDGVKLPARQSVRDYCDHDYRVYDVGTGAFNYDNATCPFADSVYLDALDNPVPISQDVCGKRLGSCRSRFGVTATLPFRGFPGMAKARVR